MGLFNLGDFTLHSGQKSNWIIDCNALSDKDLECLAKMAMEKLAPFNEVVGIPRGGLRWAKCFEKYINPDAICRLIVDDVYTTGNSIIEEARKGFKLNKDVPQRGVVMFARKQVSQNWITAVLTYGVRNY